MADATTLLAKLNAAIEAKLDGGFDEYAEGDQRFKGLSLEQLFAWRRQLQLEVAATEHCGLALGSVVPAEGG